MIEVLDATGQTIKGYEKESCVIKAQDSVKLPIQWGNTTTLPSDVPIRLRFHLQSRDLISYVIE
jgi:tellurite resistance-related uncharacterized protein